jgi:DNA-binding IclR family transcriptional regulator
VAAGEKVEPASGTIRVIAKAGAILDALAERDFTAQELADRFDEPLSTIYRLLSNLQGLGYVAPSPNRGHFRLGTRLLALGAAVAQRFDGREAALPAMKRLQAETGETIFFAVLDGAEALYVERLDGRLVGLMAVGAGSRLKLNQGACGKALLAFAPAEFREEFLAKADLKALTAQGQADRKAVLKDIEGTRDRGYSISDEDVVIGMASIGAPIYNHRGEATAAMSVSGVRPSVLDGNEKRVANALLEEAHNVSAALGFEAA